MYETRAYDNEHGDPVVVLVATGTHDVSRLAGLLDGSSPNSEHRALADQVTRQVRRRHGGRAALRLLAEHGGPDLLTPVGETTPMFDVAADVPDIPEHGPASAVELAKAYAARTGYAMRYAHEIYPASGHPDQPAALRRARDHYNLGQYMYGVVHLLRALIKHAPEQADQVAASLWQDWIDGDGSERLSDWLGAWGLDIDHLTVKAIDDAEKANADLLNEDEVALRAELAAQDAKWGVQDHPDLDPRDIDIVTHHYYAGRADIWRQVNEERATPTRTAGRCNGHPDEPHPHTAWDGILLEETYEALGESDPAALSAELLQVAAVAIQWRRTIRRRPAPALSVTPQEEAAADV